MLMLVPSYASFFYELSSLVWLIKFLKVITFYMNDFYYCNLSPSPGFLILVITCTDLFL